MTTLIQNREDTRWLIACRTIGTGMLIILARLLSLAASLVAISSSLLFRLASLRVAGINATQAWLTFPAEETAFLPVQGLILVVRFRAPLVC